MDSEMLVALLVGLPVVAGALCYLFKNKTVIKAIVSITAVALIGSTILLYQNGGFILETSMFIDDLVLIIDFALLIYFLYIGWQKSNLPIIALTLTYIVPLAYFEYWHYNEAITPTMIADQLSITISIIVGVIGSIVCVYALPYMDEHSKHMESLTGRDRFVQKANIPKFFLFMLLLLGAMNGLVYSNDLTWLAFFWEITTLCCYELIRYDGSEVAEANAQRALWMGIVGGAAFMGALWLSYQYLGTPTLQALLVAPPTTAVLLIFALLAVAAFSKSAQLPFHNWLLGAMVAPTPVSALLHSSTMVISGVYLVLRIAPRLVGTNLSYGIAAVGIFTFMYTSVMALNQRVSKSILAYSTIGNLGLMIFCASMATPLSYSAAIILLIFHSMSKGLLFMAAGIIENKLHSRNIADWQGLLARLPFTTTVMIIGIVSMFLPIFGVLLGKWAAVGVVANAPLLPALAMIVMLLVGSSASMLFWAKWLGNFIMAPAGKSLASEETLSFTYKFTLIVLLVLDIAASIGSGFVIGNFVVPTMIKQFTWLVPPDPAVFVAQLGGFLIWQLWITIGAVIAFGLIISRSKKSQLQPAYLSGENVEDNPIAFRTTADTVVDSTMAGMFFDPTINSSRWERWAVIASIGLIALTFALVVL
ncbi:MAG: proton-conducting transporter membrane subunit [Candidatus Bathyarchaeota archaeon]|nr:proton-conducting transporter membrane subunit [Candidatus Bathyarchaeota archaeon]